MEPDLESLVEEATDGDKLALEEIIRRIQNNVYGLALRMLWHPSDAEDATQEILIKVITNLSSFRHESAFPTWVYRVASNYLLTTRKRRAEREELSFEQFGEQLDTGLSDEPHQVASEVEYKLLIEEVKIGCTQGMLLCLDRDHRIAYILGEILELTSGEGAYILDITVTAFRKRLSRARQSITEFMQRKCGIFNPANSCRCARRVKRAIEVGRMSPDSLLFSAHPASTAGNPAILEGIQEIEEMRRAAAIYHSNPAYAAPDVFGRELKELIGSGKLRVMEEL